MPCERCGSTSLPAGARVCEPCAERLAEQRTVVMKASAGLEKLVRGALGKDHDIERQLGRGGMSVVYLARELELQRLVALKVLSLELSQDEEAVDRFDREARIAASLDHPHIVPVYRVGRASTFLWYSMKYVKGRSLAAVLASGGALNLDLTLDILGQVAAALDYAHGRGIIHRDIKPENVMLDGHGWAWVCDFGIAKAFGSIPLTQTGSTVGTPGYMSPEQCYGQTLDGRADQYALAIMTWQMLAGRRPFEAESLGEMIRMQCLEPPPPLQDARPGTPDRVNDALLRAMSKKPAERFESVRDFIEAMGGSVAGHQARSALQQLIQAIPEEPVRVSSAAASRVPAPEDTEEEESLSGAIPAARTAPARPRRTSWRVAAGVVVTLGAAAGAYAALGPDGEAGTTAPVELTVLDTAAAAENDSAGTATPPDTAPAEPPARPAAQPARTAPPETTAAALPGADLRPGVLQIASQPWGNVYLNDSLVGATPILGLRVPAGTHALVIRQDCYAPLERTVTVPPGDTVRLTDITLERVCE